MDVYLVPVGSDGYELYCEVPDDPAPPEPEAAPARGVVGRLKQRFSDVLAEAERQRHHPPQSEPRGWFARAKARTMRWVAESIAEQRLLWHLRRQDAACLFYPDDIDEPSAVAILRDQLRRDFEKHRFWLIVDSIGFVASGLLFLVPGPNIVAYYFAFRMVGHFLSRRGARQGLDRVTWTAQGRAPLAELRRAAGLVDEEREKRVHEVAVALHLEHFATFFERVCPSADA